MIGGQAKGEAGEGEEGEVEGKAGGQVGELNMGAI